MAYSIRDLPNGVTIVSRDAPDLGKFTVHGTPRAKARARRGPAGNWYTPDTTEDWERLVKWEARAAGIRVLDGPVEVVLLLVRARPRRPRQPLPPWPLAMPDVDNATKAVLDALNGIAYVDDRQVVHLEVLRAWGTENRVDVHLRPMPDATTFLPGWCATEGLRP